MKQILRRLRGLILPVLLVLLFGCASEQPEPEQVMEPAPAESIMHEPAAAPSADETDLLRKRRKDDDSDDMDRQD